MSGNREYKSDVFSMLMEDPQNALDLYNAVNHSSYTDPDLVEINTLEKGISLTVQSDRPLHKGRYPAGVSDSAPLGGDESNDTGLYV